MTTPGSLAGTAWQRRTLLPSMLAAAVLGLASASAGAQTRYNFALMGASPGGLWSLLGSGIHAAIADRYAGSAVTYQTSGGGLANVVLVSQGRADMGIIHNVELKAALTGSPPFKQPYTNLRAIAYLYNWAPMQLVITRRFAERYGTSMEELIAAKAPVRFGVNTRGNMVQELNRQILAAYGVTYEEVDAWGGQIIFAASGEMGDLMADRRIDMSGNGLFAPDSTIVQTGNAVDVTLLSLNDGAIAAVAAATGAEPYTIVAGTYQWLERDVKTVALGAELVVSEAMPAEVAYDVTKALVENIDRIRGVHAAMRALTPGLMASQVVIPYHDGALRYYREAGLIAED